MEVKIEKGTTKGSPDVLCIRIPMNEPRPSVTGKTLTVATTSGNVVTTCEHPSLKRPIKIGLNAYCAKE